jgi:hypothetical protein
MVSKKEGGEGGRGREKEKKGDGEGEGERKGKKRGGEGETRGQRMTRSLPTRPHLLMVLPPLVIPWARKQAFT